MELEFLDLINSKKKKKKINRLHDIFREKIWSHKCASHPVDLPIVMNKNGNDFNYAYSLLFSDIRDIYGNDQTYNKKKINKKKTSNFAKYISNDSEKLLNKIYAKINFVKNQAKELQKLNTLGLQKTAKSYFRTNRPKTSILNNIINTKNRKAKSSANNKPKTINFNLGDSGILIKNRLKIKNNSKNVSNFNNSSLSKNEIKNINNNTYQNSKINSFSNINNSSKRKNMKSCFYRNKNLKNFINFNKSSLTSRANENKKLNIKKEFLGDTPEEKFNNLINIDVPKLYLTTRNKELNLGRLNEIYRVQMNKSFSKYNTENHLKELNKIQRDDISVRHDMEDIKSAVNQKINDRNHGLYYKKEYLKLLEENEKDKKRKSLEKKPFPIQIPFNILFRNTKENPNVKVFPYGYKIRAYYDYCVECEKIQKSKNIDLIELGADLFFGHINNKNNDLLYNSLDQLYNTLDVDPIVKYIDNFKNQKVNRDKNVLNERIKSHFPVLSETERSIQKMEQNQIIKRKALLEEGNILEKIADTKKLLNEKINYNY